MAAPSTIRDWGAAAVVTLLEPEELKLLKVERLGEAKSAGFRQLLSIED
jgi:hypothetical protein